MEQISHKYQVKVVQNIGGKGGTEGRVATLSEPSNGNFLSIKVQSPAEFKGPSDAKGLSLDWTPEHLFVSSVAVCYFTTFVAIAERSNLNYKGIEIQAEGTLEKTPEGTEMMTFIKESVKLIISNPDDMNKAKRICEKTEQNCLIANSMKSKVILEIEIKVG